MSWNGSDKATASPSPSRLRGDGVPARHPSSRIRRSHLITILLIAIALAGAAVWWFGWGQFAKEQTPSTPQTYHRVHGPIAEAIHDKSKTLTLPDEKDKSPKQSFQSVEESEESKSVETNVSQTKKEDKRPFKTSVEQALNWIFNTKIGDMPPLPPMEIPKEAYPQLLETLNRPIEITEEDSDKIADDKDVVNLAKEELKNYMANGGDPNEFMRYYRQELVKAFEYRKMCLNEVENACDRDTPENVRDFFKAVNQHLREKGLDEIEISVRRKEQIQLNEDDNDE